MRIPCSACERDFPRLVLHRVGARVLCKSCYTTLQLATGGPLRTLRDEERRAIARLDVALTVLGLLAKSAFFVFLFVWARATPVGAAVLEGVVFADVLTWLVFTAIDWPFRKVQVTAGLLFQLALVLAFLHRAELFEIAVVGTEAWAMFASFLVFGALKCFVWGAQTVLEVTGVSE